MSAENRHYDKCCPECGGTGWEGCGSSWHDQHAAPMRAGRPLCRACDSPFLCTLMRTSCPGQVDQ